MNYKMIADSIRALRRAVTAGDAAAVLATLEGATEFGASAAAWSAARRAPALPAMTRRDVEKAL